MNSHKKTYPLFTLFLIILFIGCKKEKKEKPLINTEKQTKIFKDLKEGKLTPEGMVWIDGGEFTQGALDSDTLVMKHEKPAHVVSVDGFFMDITEVTNAQFQKFVSATKYKTIAEREISWEEIKKQLPEDSPKPHDSILQPGSLIFKKTKNTVPNLFDYSQWWLWKIGANWKHPKGPGSTLKGKENHPVVHIAYDDAVAYCEWAGRRLPTEAEWEYASRGINKNTVFFWGNDKSILKKHVNSWEGEFPKVNTLEDGYENTAPVKTYTPNSYELYDMAGNVWEWTQDWYNISYYDIINQQGLTHNPKGADKPFNPSNPALKEKIIKGGSFLCSDSYCASYRSSARMATSIDSSLEHLGFRTVASLNMVVNRPKKTPLKQ